MMLNLKALSTIKIKMHSGTVVIFFITHPTPLNFMENSKGT